MIKQSEIDVRIEGAQQRIFEEMRDLSQQITARLAQAALEDESEFSGGPSLDEVMAICLMFVTRLSLVEATQQELLQLMASKTHTRDPWLQRVATRLRDTFQRKRFDPLAWLLEDDEEDGEQ